MSDDDALPPSYRPRRGRRDRGRPEDTRPTPSAGDGDARRADDGPRRTARGAGRDRNAQGQGTVPVRRSLRTGPTSSPRHAPADRAGIPARGDTGATRAIPAVDDASRRPRTGRPAEPLPPTYTPRSSRPAPSEPATAAFPAASDPRRGEPWQDAPPPGQPYRQEPFPPPPPPRQKRRRRRRPGRVLALLLVLLLAVVIAWPVGLAIWADGRISHTDALSGAEGTTGTTYLLAGTDQRGGAVEDGVEGSRSDSILVLHVPESGNSSLVSLPRDTLVEIPGIGEGKLNSAYSRGGAELLVETVEGLMGLTVDHYVEIGMSGLADVVDTVGGVELCLDYDVQDDYSGLDWTAGCHVSDGETALAFARMRYADPTGDIGRGERQRQVIGGIADAVASPGTLLDPRQHVSLARTGTDVLLTDNETGIVDLGRLALAFRGATNDGFVGAPPIADPAYDAGALGSAVLLDPDALPGWLQSVRDGTIDPAEESPTEPAGG
ncbi:MAG: LCP family glycopolymer transferase [Actinomycetaceae bacterium]